MKTIAVYLIFIILSSCHIHESATIKKSKNDTLLVDLGFNSFVNSFISKKLPFSVKCKRDYLRSEIFNPITTEHKANIFQPVKNEDLKYLYDKDSEGKNFRFRYGYKIIDTTDIIGIIYLKDSINDDLSLDPSWLYLNTYTKNGSFIKKIKLAGDRFDVEDMFCEISEKKEIETLSYYFIPDSLLSADYIHAKFIVTKYSINEVGLIRAQSVDEKKGYFKVDQNGCYDEIVSQ